MSKYSKDELRKRAFKRLAWVLWHYWEEQQDDLPRAAKVHSRLFDTLIYDEYITLGRSIKVSGTRDQHREHLVPCAMLRDKAFSMYWDNKSPDDVADMFERFLRIAFIHKAEAHDLDFVRGWKASMPHGWDFENGSVTARIDEAGIKLEMASR